MHQAVREKEDDNNNNNTAVKKAWRLSRTMSFFSGSAWQQTGIIGNNSGYMQPSSGQQPQQHQQQKQNNLPATSVPAWQSSSQDTQGTQEVSKLDWTSDDVKFGRGRNDKADGSLNIGSLGSTGQSPSSPLSPYSSPSSPSVSPGKDFAHTSTEAKQIPSNFGNSHQNFNPAGGNRESNSAFYIQGAPLVSQGSHGSQDFKPVDSGKGVEKKNSGDVLCSQKDAIAGLSGSQIRLEKHNDVLNVTTHQESSKNCLGSGLHFSKVDDCISKDSNAEDKVIGSCTALNKDTKTTQQPQRTVVRRAMSDCSHLSVPMVMTGPYPTGMGGSPVANLPNFALMGTACPPRPPYPHVAVRRAFTVSDSTEAMLMAAPLTPVVPSSPPPKRHHGTSETNLLLPVPPSVNSSQDGKPNTTGNDCIDKRGI